MHTESRLQGGQPGFVRRRLRWRSRHRFGVQAPHFLAPLIGWDAFRAGERWARADQLLVSPKRAGGKIVALRRPRFQFRLSTLLWLTLAVACRFGGTAWERRQMERKIVLIELQYALKSHGGLNDPY